MNLFGKLAGKKTYITMALAILTALGAYLTGDLRGSEALIAVLGALGLGGLRHGVTTAVKDLKTPPAVMVAMAGLALASMLTLSGCVFDGVNGAVTGSYSDGKNTYSVTVRLPDHASGKRVVPSK